MRVTPFRISLGLWRLSLFSVLAVQWILVFYKGWKRRAPPLESPQQEQDLLQSKGYQELQRPPLPPWVKAWFLDWELDSSLLQDQEQDGISGTSTTGPSKLPSIDMVYTWVNGSDPAWRQSREYHASRNKVFLAHGINATKVSIDSARRWRDNSELKHSIRGVHQYGSSVLRNIHIVTADTLAGKSLSKDTTKEEGQVPSWLDRSADAPMKMEVVHHSQIFQDKDSLPTFNSIAIESQLHHIPGLSDVFIYMNDDVFVGRPISHADFWTPLYGYVPHDPLVSRDGSERIEIFDGRAPKKGLPVPIQSFCIEDAVPIEE